jgi:hypothetical protein
MSKVSLNLAEKKIKLQGNIETTSLINMKHVRVMGVDGMEKPKMPPELVQKMREVLAVGLAKNFIKKAIEELQPKDCEKESPLVKSKNAC